MTSRFDLLLKGGEAVDPTQGLHAVRDIAFAGGKVAEISVDIAAADAASVIDASGSLVVPGLVDLHCHFFYGMSAICRDPRTELAPTGTTCAVDAGTAGIATFINLREFIIKPGALAFYAFLNIEILGMVARRYVETKRSELANAEKAAAMAMRNRDSIVGIKVQLPGPHHADAHDALPLLRLGAAAAREADVPLMVHLDGGVSMEDLVGSLKPGDVVTHAFQGREPTIIGPDGRVHPAVRDAVDAGVVLDMAPAGRNHFSWRTAVAAAEDGLWPHVISSDYATSPKGGPHGFMRTLPESMSMMLSLGMELDDVVRAVTATPASVIGRGDEHGSLAVGRCGDATILRMSPQDEDFPDMESSVRTITQVLDPVLTVRRGSVLWQRQSAEVAG